MKNLVIFLSLLCFINLGFSGYLYFENKKLKDDVSNLESTLTKLDIEALEKIRMPEVRPKCGAEGTGDWLASLNCE
jgi:hypothetical protein